MPRFCVKQPNGLYAEFSTVVDDFTVLDMTRTEAVEHYRLAMSQADAEQKVLRADEENLLPVNRTTCSGPPLARWNDCLKTIEAVHGAALRDERIAEIDNAIQAAEAIARAEGRTP